MRRSYPVYLLSRICSHLRLIRMWLIYRKLLNLCSRKHSFQIQLHTRILWWKQSNRNLLSRRNRQRNLSKQKVNLAQQQPTASAYSDSASYKITGTKTKYTIKEGETLTKVSLRFYGTKAMWPYIVKHNPKVIKNPDNVPYGTTIEIPELTKDKNKKHLFTRLIQQCIAG